MEKKPSNPELYEQLRDLIYAEGHKERECSKYLEYVKYILFKENIVDYEYLKTEYRGTSGDIDFVISGIVELEVGIKRVHAYIWELKSPQCYQFEYDNDNRIKPTKELIQAENQLLWYLHEKRGDQTFQRRFSVLPNHIYCGGIIIGCDQTLVKDLKKKYDDETKRKLYEDAITIRDYFYNEQRIRLMTWNHILRQFAVEEHKDEMIAPGTKLPISNIPD